MVLAAAVAETFDPESLQEELLLVQPRFRQPAVEAVAAAAPEPAAIAEMQDPIFRVQVMALSNGSAADATAQKLQRRLQVPVVVDQHKQLFLVRAGAFLDEEEAIALRTRIAALEPAFESAYVVQVRALDEPAAAAEADPLNPEPVAIDSALPEVEMVREFGWRVLLNQFLVHEKARSFKLRAQRDLRRSDIDVTFKEPYYKVEVGNFRDEAEAQLLAERIQNRGFPYNNALKVRGEILVRADAGQ